MRRHLAAAILFFGALSASAGTITSINPSSFKVNSGEHFITIYGSGLGNVMVFDGPAGHFEINTNANFSGNVVGWVPEPIIAKSGTYSLYVRGGTGTSNTVNFTVSGIKFFPLVLFVPEAIRVQPRNREGGYAKYEVLAAGGEDPSPKVDCFPASGEWFKLGTTEVKCTASNIYGERAEASFTVNMLDQVPPVLQLPLEPIVVKATSIEGAKVDFDVKASDAIWGDAPVDCLPRSGSNFPIGVTTVQCIATDVDLNVGNGTFTVEVLGDREPYPLTVILSEESIFVEAESPEGARVDYKIEVLGTDDPSPEVTCNYKPGELFPIGTTTVVCDAIDAWGMRGQGTFDVTVFDPEPPLIEKLYADPDVLVNDGRIVPIQIVVSATDRIDLQPYCAVFDVTANEKIDLSDGDDPKNYQWAITGPLTVELRATRGRVAERIYEVWVSCQDFYGNQTREAARVVVRDTSGSVTAPPAPAPTRRRSVRH